MSAAGSNDAAGIWRFAELFDEPAVVTRAIDAGWTLNEGDTPLQELPELADRLGVGRLLVKREDLNPGGSHKDRGLLFQVAYHAGSDPRVHVLSSSGNAAVSAAAACHATGDRLVAFISPDTAPAKRERLMASDAVLVQTSKPINFARYAARVFGLQNLRGTQDPVASHGYRSLAGELAEELPEADVFFTFSSSGISMLGIADGYERSGRNPALWAVQSGECLGLVRVLDPDVKTDPSSLAGRLGIRNPPDATDLVERLRQTGGGAIAIPSGPVSRWHDHLANGAQATSAEGAAVLAGVELLARDGRFAGKTVVAVFSGHASQHFVVQSGHEMQPNILQAETYLDVRALLMDLGLEPN